MTLYISLAWLLVCTRCTRFGPVNSSSDTIQLVASQLQVQSRRFFYILIEPGFTRMRRCALKEVAYVAEKHYGHTASASDLRPPPPSTNSSVPVTKLLSSEAQERQRC